MFNGALKKTLQKKEQFIIKMSNVHVVKDVILVHTYNDETSRHDFNLVFLLLENEIFGLAISREN